MIELDYAIYEKSGGITYSIDMLYIRGFLCCSTKFFKSLCDSICSSYRSFKGRCTYSWFEHMFLFDGLTIYCGLFDEFDNITRSWSTLPLAEIRFNPNKICLSDRYNEILKLFFDNTCDCMIRKFDLACDVPVQPSMIVVDSKRKFSSLNNGETRYYGAFGSDSHIKVYNKSLELFCKKEISKEDYKNNPLTRIELTLKTSSLDSFIKEKFYCLSSFTGLPSDLNDTELCIINLFERLRSYEPDLSYNDLKLGRKMFAKLKPYFMCESNLLSINLDMTKKLLNQTCEYFKCSY